MASSAVLSVFGRLGSLIRRMFSAGVSAAVASLVAMLPPSSASRRGRLDGEARRLGLPAGIIVELLLELGRMRDVERAVLAHELAVLIRMRIEVAQRRIGRGRLPSASP